MFSHEGTFVAGDRPGGTTIRRVTEERGDPSARA